jgi:hypothetical protein
MTADLTHETHVADCLSTKTPPDPTALSHCHHPATADDAKAPNRRIGHSTRGGGRAPPLPSLTFTRVVPTAASRGGEGGG